MRLVREQMSQIWDKEIVQKVQGMKNDSRRDSTNNSHQGGLSNFGSNNAMQDQDMAMN